VTGLGQLDVDAPNLGEDPRDDVDGGATGGLTSAGERATVRGGRGWAPSADRRTPSAPTRTKGSVRLAVAVPDG